MAYLTDAQIWGLLAATWTGAGLSLCGSSFLTYSIIRTRKFTKDAYHRLLLSLSINDIISSLAHIVGSFLLPADSSQRTIVARGNTATCEAVGFIAQYSVIIFLYNAYMAVYFLAIIRYEIKDQTMIRMECFMHTFAFSFSLGTAFWGLANDLYNELGYGGLVCWLSDFPDGCTEDDEVECERGIHTARHGYFMGMIPSLICPVTVFTCNLLIYLKVRKVFSKMSNNSSGTSGTASNFRESNLDAGRRRIRAAATQSFFYVLSFMNSFIWMLTRFLDSQPGNTAKTESRMYGLIMISQFLFPLQGFTNLLVHLRPQYLRHRKKNPNLSRLGAFRKAMVMKSAKNVKKKQQKPRFMGGIINGKEMVVIASGNSNQGGAAHPPGFGNNSSLQSEENQSSLKEEDEEEVIQGKCQGKFQEDEKIEEVEEAEAKGHKEASMVSAAATLPSSDASLKKSSEVPLVECKEEFLEDSDNSNDNSNSASLPDISTTNNQVSSKHQKMSFLLSPPPPVGKQEWKTIKHNEENTNACFHQKPLYFPRFMPARMAIVATNQNHCSGGNTEPHQYLPRVFREGRMKIEQWGSSWQLHAVLGDESDDDENEND